MSINLDANSNIQALLVIDPHLTSVLIENLKCNGSLKHGYDTNGKQVEVNWQAYSHGMTSRILQLCSNF